MVSFTPDMTYMPVTPTQFEGLTNELLVEFNKLADPQALDAEFFAEVLMGALHSVERGTSWISKSKVFDSCVNKISNRLTFKIVEEMHKRKLEQEEQKQTLVESEDDFTNEPLPTH